MAATNRTNDWVFIGERSWASMIAMEPDEVIRFQTCHEVTGVASGGLGRCWVSAGCPGSAYSKWKSDSSTQNPESRTCALT